MHKNPEQWWRAGEPVSEVWGFVFFLAAAATVSAAQTLDWQQREGFREAQLIVKQTDRVGFTLLPVSQTGIHFTNHLSYERSERNQNLLNGAGLAAGDFDGDGLCDLYFCNLEGSNALYRNRGDWKFEDVTASASVACAHQTSRGPLFADINGDRHLDLLVSSLGGPNAAFLNDGRGHFTNMTEAAGLVLKAGGHSLAMADIEGDGDLDLYVANYGENSILRSGGEISVRPGPGGQQIVSGRHARRLKLINGQLVEYGEPHVLYLNDGKGVFKAASWTDGRFTTEDGKPLKAAFLDLGLSVMFRDINGDGFPDIYVCNDFQSPDRIWINDGRGNFRALPDLAIRSTSHFSMGVDFADIDRDGFDEFVVSDMLSRHQRLRLTQMNQTNPPPGRVGETWDRNQIRRNTLQWNRGDGTYVDIANYAGVDASDWSWSVVFLDVDLDGFEDLLIANGHTYDTLDLDMHEKVPSGARDLSGVRIGKLLKDFPPLEIPNVLFRNRGNRTFEEVGQSWGFNSTNVSHGISLADLDNDGDLDVAVSCLWKPPLLYRNDSSAPRVAVRLKGKTPNTQGIGAKIKVLGGAVPVQTQEMICGGRYLAADDPMRVFAAGTLTNKLTIEITWRNGTRSIITEAKANHIYEIDETGAKPVSHPQRSTLKPQPIFKDVSDLIAHTHDEVPFNDFERQPLLHKSLSQLGPGLGWHDLDGDGNDELIIGSGKGGRLAIYRNDGKGGFVRWQADAWNSPAPDDQAGMVGASFAAGKRSLLIGISKYESAENTPSVVQRYDIGSAPSLNPQSAIRNAQSVVGPIALADVDGDDDLDLFVGGRVVPGRFPEAASSEIFKNNGGVFQLDEGNNPTLKGAGLVSAAVFSDLNGDGWPELVLACEWGPVRVFQNISGKLREATAELGLTNFTGWWNGVTTGDIDGDGQLDIVASNWGLNSSYYGPSASQPLQLYFGDFDGNGTVDLLEAYTDSESKRIVPRRDLLVMSMGIPALRLRFPTHAAYSAVDVNAILGDQSSKAQRLQAGTLASMLFLNRTNRFEAVPLPFEAQLAPAFGVNVADMDGDGHEDIFLSQNFFAMRPEEPRLDGGRGLWLRGDGTGKLVALSANVSGVTIHGEQRGSALCDFNGDGRVDLAVAQNRATTKLFRNEGARPGLRVRLNGPAGNPDAIGAVVRLKYGERLGPAREIHAGSGYWSQDSNVQTFGLAVKPTALWIRWPGGKITTTDIPTIVREIVADPQGRLVAKQ